MSDLADLLAGHLPAGVYRWASTPSLPSTPDVRRAVERSGAGFAHVDTWGTPSKAAFLDAVGLALGFPDYYGHNFDALADCLSDVAAGTVLLWDGWGPFARVDERAFGVALEVLREAAESERFAVLLRGDGPDVGLPVLG